MHDPGVPGRVEPSPMSWPARPLYHPRPAAGWVNDPHGLVHHNGRYHVFAQHLPDGLSRSDDRYGSGSPKRWAHLTSDDLVHWVEHPPALVPSPGGADEDGCWTGSIVVTRDGPTAIYTGVRRSSKSLVESVCLAHPLDEKLESWRADGNNPVIPGPPSGLDTTGFRDPHVSRIDGAWRLLVGSGIRDRGGMVLEYRSTDLRRWQYRGVFASRSMKDASPVATGEMWECPQYVELSGRRLLTISPDIPEERGAIYFLGDERDGQFNPESVAAFDLGPDFHAAALVQDPSGRLLCWAWSPEATAHATQVEAGWQGVLTLPREVSLASDGSLAIVPARELEALRGIRHSVRGLVVPADGSYRAPVEADAAEIDLVLDVGAAEEVAIAVLASARAEEETRIVYRRARDEVAIDRERSSERDDVRGGRHGGRLGRRPGERVHLRIFVDRSIVEAFANNRRTITSRVYPRRPDSRGIVVTAAGDAAVIERLDVWPVDPQEQWAPVY